uniref:SXP/RAL-2 family protein Ani s 5-like cation-binding domain-containing protein n=1 Tax=Caenorhabditis japonica TaxID=281687 RepID=A0A8R1IHP7_CAEJA
MFARVSAIVVLLGVAVNAGFFDDVSGVTSDVGNFFSTQFNNAKDLFSNDQTELEKNVQRVKDLLSGVKEKVKMLEPMANDAQKETLKKVDTFLQQVTGFQQEIVGCGIEGVTTTSLTNETGRNVSISEARPILLEKFAKNFECLLAESADLCNSRSEIPKIENL